MKSMARVTNELTQVIATLPVVDVHSHPFPELPALTEEILLETLGMSAWRMDAYFPAAPGEATTLYARWRAAAPAERERLDRQYGIRRRFDDLIAQLRSTLFVHCLVQEMSKFLRCKPTLAHVVAARNEYTRGGYWQYVNDLFASVHLEDALVQSGLGALSAWTSPEPAFAEFASHLHARVHPVVTAGAGSLLEEDISFADFVLRYRAGLVEQAKRHGAVAFKTGVVKTTGADVQPVSFGEADTAWQQYRKLSAEQRRRVSKLVWRPECYKVLQDFIVWQCCGVAWELDVPLHVHAGSGESQTLFSKEYPYRLENVVRYPVELPQQPLQIVLLHAGYPYHGEAAYLTHIFPNVWFDMSILTPFTNRSLTERLLEVFEVAPLNKILYGSDCYHVPELSYLAAKWAKRSLGAALGTLVEAGTMSFDAAVAHARAILADNARRLHKIAVGG